MTNVFLGAALEWHVIKIASAPLGHHDRVVTP